MRKSVFEIYDQVCVNDCVKLGCKTTVDGLRLEIKDLESRWIVLSM